uniref:Yos1-like protein n=1 Tax=Tetraselmis sp. GSL018 TaxID=582737 RepID=A0A061RMS0_9CHLO|mmetsp:Transcript_29826/g.71105  ORF Transcript_29826/g.71105 Transcript_29826/m.71105 type:complete len:82 (-) Transcript_29826:39-284(-)
MSLWTLVQASLMFANGFAIVNNDRFLEKHGWGYSALYDRGYGLGPGHMKRSTIGFLHACSYLRLPLLMFNVIVIFVKLLFG